MRELKAILLDADDVIQRRPAGWPAVLQQIVGPEGDPDGFLGDVFSEEDPALYGDRDFIEALSDVRRRWNCPVPLAHLLHVWTMIDVDPHAIAVIRDLRRNGIQCHLASNQEVHKARFMSEVLGYRQLFDREFYSCHLGVAKPARAFFETVVDAVGEEPDRILFVDDRPDNVEAARHVGIRAIEFSLGRGEGTLRRILADVGLHIRT
jgi:putative hydrolase of the HAD superfamily